MTDNESMDFFGELDHFLSDDGFRPLVITLVSGRQFVVSARGQSIVYRNFYHLFPANRAPVMFPFSQVSCVELLGEKQTKSSAGGE